MSAHTTSAEYCGDAEQDDQLPRAAGVLDRAATERGDQWPAVDHAHDHHQDRDRDQDRSGKLREKSAGQEHRATEDADRRHSMQRRPHRTNCRREEQRRCHVRRHERAVSQECRARRRTAEARSHAPAGDTSRPGPSVDERAECDAEECHHRAATPEHRVGIIPAEVQELDRRSHRRWRSSMRVDRDGGMSVPPSTAGSAPSRCGQLPFSGWSR